MVAREQVGWVGYPYSDALKSDPHPNPPRVPDRMKVDPPSFCLVARLCVAMAIFNCEEI